MNPIPNMDPFEPFDPETADSEELIALLISGRQLPPRYMGKVVAHLLERVEKLEAEIDQLKKR